MMRHPRQRFSPRQRDERGAISVWFATASLVMVILVGMNVDLGGKVHAQQIQRAAKKGGIQVFVNYETTWYPSHGAIWSMVKERKEAGAIRKMVALDGHSGPKAINVQKL